ncbi:MAG: hypothetical protein ISS57_19725 [Anaerolineales bacterium]|nr:hypothetical protein [Anaerolineales bacterium]
MSKRPAYLWDYKISEADFQAILSGKLTKGRLNRDWAAIRLLEYAPYAEIIQLLGYRTIIENWHRWRTQIRAESRIRGFDFLVEWLPEHHPERLDRTYADE